MNQVLGSWLNVLGQRLAMARNQGGESRPFLNTGLLVTDAGVYLVTDGGDNLSFAQTN